MVKVKWYWAGDSTKGAQDTWIEYDGATAAKLEAYFHDKRRKRYDIDAMRYIDMSNRNAMVQRRNDDYEKRRGVKREVADSDDSDSSDDDGYVVWYWAGDSKSGKMDTWMEYDGATCRKIEKAHIKGQNTLKLDDIRYLDLVNMIQKRYDDTAKQRPIKREDSKKRKRSGGGSTSKKIKT